MAHPCPWGQVSWQWDSGLPAPPTSLLREAGSAYLPGGAARAEGQGERRALAPPRACGRPCSLWRGQASSYPSAFSASRQSFEPLLTAVQ